MALVVAPGGRPFGRLKPAAPWSRYASRQRYSTLRLIFSSLLSADTLSPFRIRRATAIRYSTLKTRAPAIRTSVRCSCHHFPVSQVWGPHHTILSPGLPVTGFTGFYRVLSELG